MSLTISPARIVEESDSPLLAAPDAWPRRPLGEIAMILNGFAFKSQNFSPSQGKPLIRIRDIFHTDTSVRYTGEYDDRYLVQPGDLLVGMDGDFNCTQWRGPEALLNQRVCKISPNVIDLDLDFLVTVLPGYLKAIHDVTSATTVTHLSSRDIARIPIPVPELRQQKHLAQELGYVREYQSSASSHLAGAQRSVSQFRQAVLAAACSGRLTADWRSLTEASAEDSLLALARQRRQAQLGKRYRDLSLNYHASFDDLPNSWGIAPLGMLLEDLKYGTSKPASRDIDGTPVLRIPNVSSGTITLSDLKFSQLDEREKAGLSLRDRDLLMIRSNGSVGLVGQTVDVTESAVGMAYAGYLLRLRLDEVVADPHYVRLALSSPQLRTQIEMPARSTSGVNNINSTEVKQLAIPLPPLGEQREIVQRVDRMLTLAHDLEMHVENAERTVVRSSQAVLGKAFRGELVG